MTRSLIPLLAAVLLGGPAASRGADEPFAASIEKRGAAVLAALKKNGFTNVGVLKFLTRQGDGPFRDDSGELNTTLATRTQVALVLAADPDDPFGILDQPSKFVAENRLFGVNHTTADGRRAFFDTKYPLAWSGTKVTPGGFLVGTVTFAADLSSARVELHAFGPSGELVPILEPWQITPDAQMLGECGYSYALPPITRKTLVSGGAITPREVQQVAAESVAVAVGSAERPPAEKPFAPLAGSPVKWVVRYNGQPMTVSGNSLPEPKATDKVSFALVNESTDTYAAVLLVNGENTLYQERQDPFVCRKWVLEPRTETVISGFQVDDKTAIPFEVTKPDEPMPDEIRYGDTVGTFRLVVYAGTVSDQPVPGSEPVDGRTVIARARGSARPQGVKPQSLRALQAELLQQAKDATGSRGLVVKGSGEEKSETVRTHFAPASDQPVADITLRYFTPKK